MRFNDTQIYDAVFEFVETSIATFLYRIVQDNYGLCAVYKGILVHMPISTSVNTKRKNVCTQKRRMMQKSDCLESAATEPARGEAVCRIARMGSVWAVGIILKF